MYTIIPLQKERIEEIRDIADIDMCECSVVGIQLMACLLMRDDYPIKNKRLAIANILRFLRTIDTMLQKESNGNYKTLVSISSKILINAFTKNYYKKYMRILQELDILTAVPYTDGTFYTINERTQQYRIHNIYLTDQPALVVIGNADSREFDSDNKYDQRFENTIKHTEIDYTKAIIAEFEYCESNEIDNAVLRIRINRVLGLNSKRFIKKGHKVERVYHSFTNLSRISRKFLSVKGNTFTDVDIRNCQPLLLCYLLKSKCMGLDQNYIDDCQSGTFYERFITEKLNRSKAKVRLYSCIFFKFISNSDIAMKFKELYPLTYVSLMILNQQESVAALLQNAEASIFNDLKPILSKHYYTLFDSIYFTDIEDCTYLIRKIKEKFAVHNIKVTLTINGETEFDIK